MGGPEQNVRQLMAEHEALALAQAEVAQELAYHAGRLGRKALGAADHVLAAGGQGPGLIPGPPRSLAAALDQRPALAG